MQLYDFFWAFGHKTLKKCQKHPKKPIFCTYKNHSAAPLVPSLLLATQPNSNNKSPKYPPKSAKNLQNFKNKMANYVHTKIKNGQKYLFIVHTKIPKSNYVRTKISLKLAFSEFCTHNKYPISELCTYKNRNFLPASTVCVVIQHYSFTNNL